MSDITRYQFQEGSITFPEGSHDRTVNIFLFGNPDASSLNISISRDTLPANENLPEYIDRQIKLMKNRLKNHKVNNRSISHLGQGATLIEGEQIETTHKANSNVYYQRQAAFIVSAGRLIIFSVTCNSPLDSTLDQLWINCLNSFQPAQ